MKNCTCTNESYSKYADKNLDSMLQFHRNAKAKLMLIWCIPEMSLEDTWLVIKWNDRILQYLCNIRQLRIA